MGDESSDLDFPARNLRPRKVVDTDFAANSSRIQSSSRAAEDPAGGQVEHLQILSAAERKHLAKVLADADIDIKSIPNETLVEIMNAQFGSKKLFEYQKTESSDKK